MKLKILTTILYTVLFINIAFLAICMQEQSKLTARIETLERHEPVKEQTLNPPDETRLNEFTIRIDDMQWQIADLQAKYKNLDEQWNKFFQPMQDYYTKGKSK